MIPVSSMSVTARYLRQILANNIPDVSVNNIYISNPKDLNIDTTEQCLNLFFYRVEYSGYPADGTPDNPVYMKMFCLITALGADVIVGDGDNQETITAGENDLRLIGAVIQVLHEHPIIKLENEGFPLHLQAVFIPMSLDDLNHLWVTQGNTDNAYRISVAYEFSLAPIPLAEPVSRKPRVAEMGLEAEGRMQRRPLTESGFASRGGTPEVSRMVVNTERPDWTPQICFIQMDKQTLHYVMQLPEDEVPVSFDILLAGAAGQPLKLFWETWQWDYNMNDGGWNTPVEDTTSPVVNLPEDNDINNPFAANIIDPENIDLRQHFQVTLPFVEPPPAGTKRQAMLYAVYEYERARPQGQTEIIQMRSNPLLVTFYSQEAD